MLVGFVRFKDTKGAELPDIFSAFDTGVIRRTMPAEWGPLRAAGVYASVPVVWEDGTELARYASYDNALRRNALG